MRQVSRFQEKQQNRRKKVVFNIAFTLVLVTVGIVTYQLFFPSDTSKKAIAQEKKATKIEEKKRKEKEAAQLEEKKRKEKEAAQLEEKEREEKEAMQLEEKKRKEKEAAQLEEERREEKEAAQLEEKQKVEKSVKMNGNENKEGEKTASQEKGSQTNSSWKPIGTVQGAKPEMKFKEGTVDWSEMKQAISYAVDVPESQLIFDFIGNNGDNKAYGNVRDKQSNKKYKVDIDWVENQGWKPASVQVVK
ncbi:FMN-dependent NADH-azoreductase [Bacillus sp. AFS051223]|uniref:YrrS family protein n=1 Tax=Bacillus sp. AFS051223 TaxID=2034280 RepID=UPI000BEC97DB|nr:YrrS family protein [Bacillus sp. AFS051223]PED57411.1 FMN-dependent NADH-azoreductase [Bacillus anthracis]PEF62594.1 FMN-dependent NADH-azoreductase [Bacillus anthracis]PFA95370.1 FMN-dependent NADH-azoreductase [Bacillus anthracis]PFP33072.1 FMN-dependent NADH-azoreductase [Bacillus anthracis]PFU24987.1 FMN-dependent NADH-azoreductase [Bacillus anthracis]